ncbi:MAG: hypothetical protein C0599_13865, partial [Salinivirgaceae bacterium]
MKRSLLLGFILILTNLVFSQKVTNVNFIVVGDEIIITYDLTGKDLFDVSCYYSIDDWETQNKLVSTIGDVGSKIRS